jgi:TRAP transporter TAXI family solute receptor
MRSETIRRAVIFSLAVGVCGCGPEGRTIREFLSLGTAGTGGIYYPLGGALASRLSVADTLRQYTAEVTGGSVENVNRLREGQIDLAFALGVSVYEAHLGRESGSEPFEDLRIVAPLYANLLHILVPRNSTASRLDDLAGARVSVGAAGSGTEQVARQILQAHGLDYETVDARFLTFSESAASLRDGAIDAAIISVGYPAAAVLEATTTGGARLLAMDSDKIDALAERYPYYTPGGIPPGTYPGVEEEIPTVAMMNWVAAREDLAGEVVERLLTILRDDRASLERVHEMAAQIDLATLADPPIPLHPAARSWLER